jgi:ribosome-binding factor A
MDDVTAVQRRYAWQMPQGPRIQRVGEEFREILAEEIPKLKDPRIGFVTVTGVKVTADLRRAWVYYTAFGDDKERASTRAGLRSAVPRLRGLIGKQVRMKFLPELAFEEDATLEQAARIDRLIARLNAGEGTHEDAEGGSDG